MILASVLCIVYLDPLLRHLRQLRPCVTCATAVLRARSYKATPLHCRPAEHFGAVGVLSQPTFARTILKMGGGDRLYPSQVLPPLDLKMLPRTCIHSLPAVIAELLKVIFVIGQQKPRTFFFKIILKS